MSDGPGGRYPVDRSKAPAEFSVSARDQEDLDRLIHRELRKASKTREDVDLPDAPATRGSSPRSRVESKSGQWERMAAKMILALLAETQSPEWRGCDSAQALRQQIRDLGRKASDVAFQQADSFRPFAAEPSTAVVVSSKGGAPAALVSLGASMVMIPLEADLGHVELGWVSDPLDPGQSVSGPIAHVVAARVPAGEPRAE
jgi:hypothetical protein